MEDDFFNDPLPYQHTSDIEDDEDDDKENDPKEESPTSIRLKSALYYTIGKILESETKKHDKSFTKEYLACLTDLVSDQCASFARDVEAFSRHGKRTTVNMDDVKLIARKNDGLVKCLDEHAQKISGEQKSKGKGRKRKAESVVIDD